LTSGFPDAASTDRALVQPGRVGTLARRSTWQSGSDGRDETPRFLYNARAGHWMADRSHRQRPVGLAVAYGLWQHWQSTGDTGFFFGTGAEVFLETARFFADLATFDTGFSRWRSEA
jgi:trehalose/maltose hydrolase-like predicted phosphorylase